MIELPASTRRRKSAHHARHTVADKYPLPDARTDMSRSSAAADDELSDVELPARDRWDSGSVEGSAATLYRAPLYRTGQGLTTISRTFNKVAFHKVLLSAFLLLCGLLLPANSPSARPVDNTLLILDASGSMWGRVEGRSKIETARDVIVDLLETNRNSHRLGLMSYGHRRKGDCRDIELLVAPAVGTSHSIQGAVMSIKPRGKTPLSASVIEAARTLRSEENKATVILVSDGRETCDYDPCQVARELERSGVDFTAHVIGFNVTDPIDLSQLRCMAENTGGQFFKADNGEELSQALQSVSAIFNQSAAREIQGGQQRRADRDVPTGSNVHADSEVQTNSQSEAMSSFSDTSDGVSPRATGSNAGKNTGNTSANAASISADGLQPQTDHVDTGEIGDIDLRLSRSDSIYRNENSTSDQKRMDRAPNANRRQQDMVRNGTSSGRSNESTGGDYVPSPAYKAPALSAEAGSVIEVPSSSAKPIDVLVKLTHPSDLYTQQVFAVRWAGPGLVDDLITIALPDSPADKWLVAISVSGGKKLKLTAPDEPGDYEVRYVSADRQILEAQKIVVRKAEATLLAPAEARSGRLVRIRWKGGTRDPRDSIVISRQGAPLSSAINRRAIRAQSSVMLLMPSRTGNYELRYIQAGGNLIGSKPIVVR